MTEAAPTTVVSGVMPQGRSFQFGMFADITDVIPTRTLANGVTTLTFATELTAEQVDAIWWRMTSRDDTDQVARCSLAGVRDDLAAAPLGTLEDALVVVAMLRDAAVAHLTYMLGD